MADRKYKVKETIYHGTISKIDKISLSKGRGYKDFGKGFYLAYKKEQAVKMMNKKARESKGRGEKEITKYLYTFTINNEVLDSLNVKIFEEADMEWLDFILECRKVNGTPHPYDVVIGPTADDDTSFCLNMYHEGAYGKVGSIQAKKTLLFNLEVQNYGTQLFIGTEKGVQILASKKEEQF